MFKISYYRGLSSAGNVFGMNENFRVISKCDRSTWWNKNKGVVCRLYTCLCLKLVYLRPRKIAPWPKGEYRFFWLFSGIREVLS